MAFGLPEKIDRTIKPRVGVASGRVVMVDGDPDASDQRLQYRTGIVTTHGPTRISGGLVAVYGKGVFPDVAIRNPGTKAGPATVVAVHEAGGAPQSALFYHIGTVSVAEDVDYPSIAFGPQSTAFAWGGRVQVALNDHDVVVAVFQTEDGRGVRYCYGNVAPGRDKIEFDPDLAPTGAVVKGWTPSIAINNEGLVILTYRWRAAAGDSVWYHVGTIDRLKRTISFTSPIWLAVGDNPSVALDGQGTATFVFEWRGQLLGRVGSVDVDDRIVKWTGDFFRYHDGLTPSVAADVERLTTGRGRARRSVTIQANVTAMDRVQFAVSLGQIDRKRWMYDGRNLLGDRRLNQIALPGSHDAGMSISPYCFGGSSCNTVTQRRTVFQQLMAGCRYFDIRPALISGSTDFYTGHFSSVGGFIVGCAGEKLVDVLRGVMEYFSSGGLDPVILKFSHYRNQADNESSFTTEQMNALIALVKKELGSRLFTGNFPGGLHNLTVNDFIGVTGPNEREVLVVFDLPSPHEALREPTEGIYRYGETLSGDYDLVVFDEDSGEGVGLAEMSRKQLQRLRTTDNHQGNLFLLSWTLRQSKFQASRCFLQGPSILDLAGTANAALWPSLVEAYNRHGLSSTMMPNVIYADDIQEAHTDYAIALNRRLL